MATATYCAIRDVERVLGLKPNTFEADAGNLTSDDITEWIEAAEDEINALTNNSWKPITVTDQYYDLPESWGRYGRGWTWPQGYPQLYLMHRNIRTLTLGTDKLEVFNGTSYDDWLATKTEGRNNDFWVDYVQGIMTFVSSYPQFYNGNEIRLTYRWGNTTIPSDIKLATARKAATSILLSDDSSNYVASGDRAVTLDRRIDKWEEFFEKIRGKYWESNIIIPRRIY